MCVGDLWQKARGSRPALLCPPQAPRAPGKPPVPRANSVLHPSGLQLRVQGPASDNDLYLALSPAFGPVLIPWDLAAKSCSWQQRQDQALTAKCLQDFPAALSGGRTTSPCRPPRAACLSWAPCGMSLSRVCWGPGSAWGDGCTAPALLRAEPQLRVPTGGKGGGQKWNRNCQIPWRPWLGHSAVQDICLLHLLLPLHSDRTRKISANISSTRHWMEFKEGKLILLVPRAWKPEEENSVLKNVARCYSYFKAV